MSLCLVLLSRCFWLSFCLSFVLSFFLSFFGFVFCSRSLSGVQTPSFFPSCPPPSLHPFLASFLPFLGAAVCRSPRVFCRLYVPMPRNRQLQAHSQLPKSKVVPSGARMLASSSGTRMHHGNLNRLDASSVSVYLSALSCFFVAFAGPHPHHFPFSLCLINGKSFGLEVMRISTLFLQAEIPGKLKVPMSRQVDIRQME